ncbi:PAS domain-containing sensor histidine kinase [Sphingomonas sp. LT1P40]|uniref:PAS domain-containing sensor histidine kinase n=1 Tax=Alteristakelama amylovorans TaxID=3096166 RepID=UPI002FC7ABB5
MQVSNSADLRPARLTCETAEPRSCVNQASRMTVSATQDQNALNAIYRYAPGFIATSHGPEHLFTFANASYQRLVGREDLVGQKVVDTLPEIVAQGFIALLDKVYATGEPFVGRNMPITLTRKGREPAQHYIDFVYQPVRDADGHITGLFCEGYDVTAQKLARDEVLVLQTKLMDVSRVSAMEMLATTLAHELNQPLSAIGSYAAGARRQAEGGTPSSQEMIDTLDAIGESSQRAGDIIRRVRNLTQRRRPVREMLDLGEVIAECLTIVNIPGCEGIHIDNSVIAGIELEGDRVQIQQVVINLLRNACEATKAAGHSKVRISGSTTAGLATIRIADTGRGIPVDMPRSGFQWMDSSKPNGMGVGLSISRMIVEAHGGELWIEASGPEGSTFAFSLPIFGDKTA